MRYSLQVLGTHTGDSSPAVVVHFDTARYMFNCGEGTQRLTSQHRLRFGRLRALFLTRTHWSCLGGLPGMMFKLADGGITNFNFFGPKNLEYVLVSLRRFLYVVQGKTSITEIESSDFVFQDEHLTVRAVALRPSSPSSFSTSPPGSTAAPISRSTPELDALFNRLALRSMMPQLPFVPDPPDVTEAWDMLAKNGYSLDERPPAQPDDTVLCFICRGPDQQGKLDAAIARRLGVKPGPDMGKLKAGESVVAADGSTVHPSQCVSPSTPGPVFVIAECPSPDFIDAFVRNPTLAALAQAQGHDAVQCIGHTCGDGVLDDPRFAAWMASFPPTTRHIVISRRHNRQPIVFTSWAEIMHRMHAIDERLFPLPCVAPPPVPLDEVKGLPPLVTAAEMLMQVWMVPKPALDTSECLAPFVASAGDGDLEAFAEQVRTTRAVIAEVEAQRAAQAAAGGTSASDDQRRTDGVAVTPLGTGSAVPGKTRNVSATLLQTPDGAILLDCGEGTLGQIERRFGIDGRRAVLESLSLLFISHKHADHQLGTATVLEEWRKATEASCKTLVLVAPPRVWTWLREFGHIHDIGLGRIHFVLSSTIEWEAGRAADGLAQQQMDAALLAQAGLARLSTVSVFHCPGSFAIVGETARGFRFAFSGDCRPSEEFAAAGRGVDLLVHEATLDDDMLDDAVRRCHCTIGEAIAVSKRMRAANVLLTHFSQRYPKLPNIESVLGGSDSSSDSDDGKGYAGDARPTIGIAFDLMTVQMREFWKLPLVVPALQALFPAEPADSASDDAPAAHAEHHHLD
ncbi:hypothetical protein HK105_203531 [Polyrhizophydium stewartii]|uniref:ribonuclease Z n=1 Tax=Polyrhizophydium stewartii TaxID=2732419 RepID=A0ABR4NB48_9FUNG